MNGKIVTLSVFPAVLFFIVALAVLASGHLHEDAYILFRYARSVGEGQGIHFDAASGPTEGATDFLWMTMLGAMSGLGLDIGIGAALLNALGLSVICYSIFRIWGAVDAASLGAILVALLSGGAAAALGGFSTLAYGGLFSLYVVSLIERKHFVFALLALALPLFRPDGLLLSIGGVMAALLSANEAERRSIALVLLPVGAAGLIYFLWRWHYFGIFLPLPLLVKARTDSFMEGLGPNLSALKWYGGLLLPLCFHVATREKRAIDWRGYCIVGFGSILLFIGLCFAHQSQNIGFRFQFPIVLSLVFVFLLALREIGGRRLFLMPLAFSVLFGSSLIFGEIRYLTNKDYINSFPQNLRRVGFVVESIAVTEAGRFPFWYDAEEMIDLVGLNSARVVKSGAYAVLKDARPALIFVHHAGIYETSGFPPGEDFLVMDGRSVTFRANYQGGNPVLIAPADALRFASESDYIAVFVKYGSADRLYSHVYFISRALDAEKFIRALRLSFRSRLTYFDSVSIR